MGREVGGGIGMGKTCEPKAFSFQCMTEFTTNKKKKERKKIMNVKKKKKETYQNVAYEAGLLNYKTINKRTRYAPGH